MTNTDRLFTAIAKRHLFIPTLKEQKSDRLDFHEVSVLTLKDALQAAYDAGAASSIGAPTTEMLETVELLGQAIEEGDPADMADIWLFQVKPELAKAKAARRKP